MRGTLLRYVAVFLLAVGIPTAALYAASSLALAGSLSTATQFTVTCATTETTIGATQDGYAAFYCQNMSATSVFLGGAGVTTANAPCISTTAATCAKPDFSWDVSRGANPKCIVASGTVTLKCIAGK